MSAPENTGKGWRPIETAPRDMTEVIAINARGHVARTWFFAPSSMTRNWLLKGGKAWQPTHWMPLPEPPLPLPAQKGERE